jgi:hypothetical protein
MSSDERMREPFVHRRLSQFVDSHRCLCMLLILRATNLRDQEVGGSHPLAPTKLSQVAVGSVIRHPADLSQVNHTLLVFDDS